MPDKALGKRKGKLLGHCAGRVAGEDAGHVLPIVGIDSQSGLERGGIGDGDRDPTFGLFCGNLLELLLASDP